MDFFVLIIIIIGIVYAVKAYNRWADKQNYLKEEQEHIKIQKRREEEHTKKIEQFKKEFINSQDYEVFQRFYRCFTLAGGLVPFIPANVHICKVENGVSEVIFEKRGYDLHTTNLKEYCNSCAPQCYEALNRFAVDLLGEYAEKTGISIEWIADYLIELDEPEKYVSDFNLCVSQRLHHDPDLNEQEIIEIIKQELRKIQF